MLEKIHISSKVKLEDKTQHGVISIANRYNGIKILTFLWKKSGVDDDDHDVLIV